MVESTTTPLISATLESVSHVTNVELTVTRALVVVNNRINIMAPRGLYVLVSIMYRDLVLLNRYK